MLIDKLKYEKVIANEILVLTILTIYFILLIFCNLCIYFKEDRYLHRNGDMTLHIGIGTIPKTQIQATYSFSIKREKVKFKQTFMENRQLN